VSLQEYVALDFSVEGRAAKDLADRLQQEYSEPVVVLSSEHQADASLPPFLTRSMWEWYSQYVEHRTKAIEEVRAAFATIHLGSSGQGFLYEHERDTIEKRRNTDIQQERRQFFQKEQVQSLRPKIESARIEYDRMRMAAGGRDPEEWNRTLYIGLMTLIAIPEAVLNFRTFANMQMAFMTDAIALALTIIIAIVIAFASDVVGETFKQWRELIGGNASDTTKGTAIRKFSAAWFAFVLAMAIVSGGRYTLFATDIQRKLVTGEVLGFNDFLPFAITVGGNILVFVFGVFIAIAAHDRIPGYGRTARKLVELERKLAALYKNVLEKRVQRHQSAAQNDLDKLEQREKMQARSGAEYASRRRAFEKLRDIDNRIVSLLDKYRGGLVRMATTNGYKIAFVVTDIDSMEERARREMTSEEYLRQRIRLPFA